MIEGIAELWMWMSEERQRDFLTQFTASTLAGAPFIFAMTDAERETLVRLKAFRLASGHRLALT